MATRAGPLGFSSATARPERSPGGPRQRSGAPLGAARDEAGREARRLTKPHTPPSGLRRLIPLTLAEIRRLLHLDRHDKHATAHGLHWSNWRRGHQAAARRAHFRRHLRLQMNVI
jgi:hypothetical protein